jgi:hypothetical protein
MATDVVNISFSLTVSLEDALSLLLRCNQKNSLSVNSAKSTEKVDPPKRQSTQKGECYNRIPIPTLKNLLSILSSRYGDSVFRFSDGLALVRKQQKISSTVLRYALEHGIEKGGVRKVSQGLYTFGMMAPKYTAALEALIDIVTPHTSWLLSTLKLMAKISEGINVYFSENGLSARFFTNKDRSAMLSVNVGKEAFSVFSVQGHVKLTVSCKQLLQVLSKNKAGDIHLQLQENKAFFKAGRLNDEHFLSILGCETSASAYEIERPLDAPTDNISHSEIELSRSLLYDILRDVNVHSEQVRILFKDGKAILDSSFESQGYSKELVDNGQDIKIRCGHDEISSCFDIESIFPMVRVKLTKDDSITLKISKAAMIMELMNGQGFKIQYFVAPCRVEEVAAEEAAPKTVYSDPRLHDISDRLDRLATRMNIKSSDS